MRNWGSNIVIDGAQDHQSANNRDRDRDRDRNRRDDGDAAYELRIEAVLRQISANPVGRILLDGFDNLRNKVFIRPPTSSGRMALEQPADSINAHTSRRAADLEFTLRYDPTRLDPVAMQLPNPGFDWRPDDMLFHECVHALRQVMGVWRRTPMPEWRDREEFYAVTLTNIYLSQGGRDSAMRGDYAAVFKPLARSLRYAYSSDARDNDGRAFASKYSDELLSLRNETFAVYLEMSKLPFGWNPLREAEWRGNVDYDFDHASPWSL